MSAGFALAALRRQALAARCFAMSAAATRRGVVCGVYNLEGVRVLARVRTGPRSLPLHGAPALVSCAAAMGTTHASKKSLKTSLLLPSM
jgi:hypothetical protein